MSIGSILVGILLLAALGAAMIQPWWRPERQRVVQLTTDPHIEYEALVAAIRDLDFDYQAGVVTEADYQPLRNGLAAQAVTVLQELDRGAPNMANLEAQIEAAVSALRATRRPAAGVRPDDAGATACPECGHPVQADSRFCARCGAELGATLRLRSVQACPDCAGPIEPGDRFCATCGCPLVKEVVAV